MKETGKRRPPGFYVYEEQAKILADIPDDQAGRIIKAICTTFLTDEIQSLKEPIEQAILSLFLEKLQRQQADYLRKCEQNKEKAQKRWKKEGKQ